MQQSIPHTYSAWDIVEARRAAVARLRVRGCDVHDIVGTLQAHNVVNPYDNQPWTTSVIRRDIAVLEERWRKSSSIDTNEAVNRVLAELREVRRAAWPEKDYTAILRSLHEESLILGLHAPAKIDMELKIREMAREAGCSTEEQERAVREAQRIVGGWKGGVPA